MTNDNGQTYQCKLLCNFVDAERLSDAISDHFALDDVPPTVSFFEDCDRWRVDIYVHGQVDRDRMQTCFAAAGLPFDTQTFTRIEEKDWVTESQRFLQPIETRRFYLHGSHDAPGPADKISLKIDAGQAFGTGHHETTRLCLGVLEDMWDSGAAIPGTILDIGTGSAVLAMAAHKLWTTAEILASDIDPVAVDVAIRNLPMNSVPERTISTGGPGVSLLAADGTNDPVIASFAPADLLIANILAGPLILLAPDFAAATKTGGCILLSGLLTTQADDVVRAYGDFAIRLDTRIDDGDWSALLLQKTG